MPECGIYFRLKHLSRVKSAFLAGCFLFLIAPLFIAQNLHAQQKGDVVITNRYANIRSGPGTKYARIGRAYRGDRFSLLQTRSGWYQIMFKDRQSWVFAKLARLEESQPKNDEIDILTMQIDQLDRRVDRVIDKIGKADKLMEKKLVSQMIQEEGLLMETKRLAPGWAFVPGGGRLAAGQRIKGYGLLAGTLGSLTAGIFFNSQYRDYRKDYRALGKETSAEKFNSLHDKASLRRKLSEAFLYTAAGLYAFNILDYFFFLPTKRLEMVLEPIPSGGQTVHLSMSCSF